jgi:hypothetical protein
LAALCVGAFVDGCCGVAVASSGWQPPVDVSAMGRLAQAVSLGADAQGDAAVVWMDTQSDPYNGILAADRTGLTGLWGSPVALTPAGAHAFFPQVSVDARGDALAAWSVNGVTSSGNTVRAAFRPGGGQWGAVVDVSPAGQEAAQPSVGLDARGNAIVAWTVTTGSNASVIDASVRPVASGVWQSPVQISGSQGQIVDPNVAVDGEGNAAVVWKRYESGGVLTGNRWTVQAATRRASDRVWQSAQDVGTESDQAPPYPPGTVPQPHVVLDRSGGAIAIWQAPHPGGFEIQSAGKPASSAAWQAPVTISAPGATGQNPELAVGAMGDVMAVWQGSGDGQYAVATAALRPAGSASWQSPVNISTAGQNNVEPQVAFDPIGNAIAIWARLSGSGNVIQASSRPAVSGVWQAPVLISGAGNFVGDPQLAVDQLGNAIAAWLDPISQTAGTIIQAAAYNAGAGPPAITRPRFSPSHFRASSTLTPLTAAASRQAASGTTLLFTLSEPAKLTVTITRTQPGRRRGHTCARPNSAPERQQAPSCIRVIEVGTLTRTNELAGDDQLAFSGRLGRRALSPGRYMSRLTATNAAGRSQPVTAVFRINR